MNEHTTKATKLDKDFGYTWRGQFCMEKLVISHT